MNKDVIYIEPDDDITDVISKVENSKEKIVALVPPKKAGILRSVVNIKLIAKAALGAKKSVVLVTTDPAIVKLAGSAKLPVTKDLQSAPSIPTSELSEIEVHEEEVEEEDKSGDEDMNEEVKEEVNEVVTEVEEEDGDGEEKSDEKDKPKEGKLEKKKDGLKKVNNKFIKYIKEHNVIAATVAISVLLLVVLLVWALVIAPAVEVFVSVKTEANNFSEMITLVRDQSQEDITEGKIYIDERKNSSVEEVKYEATGKKNVGNKAKGSLVVSAYFRKNAGSIAIDAGTAFTNNGMTFYSDEDTAIVYKHDNTDPCENAGNTVSLIEDGCLLSTTVNVTAAGAGEKYNIGPSSEWKAALGVSGIKSVNAMAGGTDELITIVQQSDIDKAIEGLKSDKDSENKKALYDGISDDNIVIESTYKQTVSDIVSTPAVDEEVKEGTKPVLKVTITTSVLVVDKTKLEELMKNKIKLPENKKIFEIRNVFIDGFKEIEGGFVGKLKGVYLTGPLFSETELVDKIKGKGLGDAKREIKDIVGVKDVRIEKSFPWVMKVPNDTNKITMVFEFLDQNGDKIEEKSDEKVNEEEKTEESDKKDETE